MKKVLVLLAITLLALTSCNCGSSMGTLTKDQAPETTVSTRAGGGGGNGKSRHNRRRYNKQLMSHITARTVQVIYDCTPKAGVVVVGTSRPSKYGDGRGTGIIVKSKSNRSYIFTAAHVVQLKYKSDYKGLNCKVSIKRDISIDLTKRAISAAIVAVDRNRDIAVIAVNEDLGVNTDIETTPFPGEDVWAAGYPVQLANRRFITLSITKGTLATVSVPIKHGALHRTTAQIYFGNSGGGLWNKQGRLVGIVVILISKDGIPIEGNYFVKPVNEVIRLLVKKHRYQEVYGG